MRITHLLSIVAGSLILSSAVLLSLTACRPSASATSSAAVQTPVPLEGATVTLRLLTYNVRNSIGMDRVTDYRRTASLITAQHASIAAIQELDSITRRSRGYDALRELATLSGMRYQFNRSITFDGGSYGVGVLYADSLLSVAKLPLPGREEARSALFVELPGYVFCSTHLSLTEADRLASIALITERATRYGKPVFLAGDLNDTPSSPTIRALAASWTILSDTTQYTFPSVNPNVCIDYIAVLGKPLVRVLRAGVVADSITSDHRPVYVEVEMGLPAR